MSGKFLARASAISLTLLLAACGGDDNSAPLAGSGGGGGGTSPSTGGDSSGDTEQQVTLELGTGSGSSFQSGQMNVSTTSLSAGGSTRLEFNVVNASAGNSIFNATETSVSITSLCQSANFDSSVTTSSGSFTTTYEAGCAGDDTITARLPNGAIAIANITVAAPEVGELEFTSATPDSIALSGSSNSTRPSVSEVAFRLTDKNGNPITSGEEITFSLSTSVGGISLSQNSTQTDEQGEATTRVNAGTVASVVSVTATYTPDSGTPIQTTSAPISISATIPDQDSFSVAVEDNFLPNARNYDGVTVPISIRAADRNNNRISDAVVNFVTNAGSVQSECTLQDGACAVQWISQDPRPEDGIILVLARTVGEESFRDLNSDGKYTQADDEFDVQNDDKGEAFLDRNRNNSRDANEEYFDYNDNGQYDAANSIYNGTACDDTNVNCTTSLLEITQTAEIFMASDNILISSTTPVAPGEVCFEIAGVFSDSSGNVVQGPPPGGTQVSFSSTNGTIVAPTSFTTTTSYRESPVEQCVVVEADDTPSTGTLTVEVTPPTPFTGNAFIFRATLTD
ncbi:Ig-like domain-containing protein [Marinobacter salsuginis]|uniref:Ig-like domain-containing protein n=2 Tax=Marinobacteraceae TaxID=2887365 RepID=UPI003008340A